jgi:hypothetical protein
MPVARNAVTFSFCHTARSSSTTMATLVSNILTSASLQMHASIQLRGLVNGNPARPNYV